MNENDNLSIFDFGIPDMKTLKIGQSIPKSDAPRRIGQPIPWDSLKEYVGKVVAKFMGNPYYDGDRDPWVVCQILQFNDKDTPEATAFYERDYSVEIDETLSKLKYEPVVSAYVHDMCMPEELKRVYHIRKTEANIYFVMRLNGEVHRLDRTSYDIKRNFFADIRG